MSDPNPSVDARRALLEKRLQKARAKGGGASAIPRRPPSEEPAISSVQRRLWFLGQWEADSPAYNIPLALRLTGTLHVDALEAALQEVAHRHEVLRTTYATRDDAPALVTHPASRVTLTRHALEPSGREQVQAAFEAQARRPFALEHDLPLRADLWRITGTEHVLLLTLHHIAADGWSMGVLMKELSALYVAFVAGQPSPLAEPALQYADFAHWQNARMSGEGLASHLEAYRARLQGAPALLELPTDRPRPTVRTSNGAIEPFDLMPSVSQAVRTLAQRERVTPFVVLLSGLSAMYHRYTGQEDLVLGTTVAGRDASELEALVGCFVNTLALRTRPVGTGSTRELLQRVREEFLAVADHQALPFEKLVEATVSERNLAHGPIFQVMLSVNNIPRSALSIADLAVEELPLDTRTSKFDLSWSVDDVGESLTGAVTYNSDLFERDTVVRMVGHLREVLAGMAARPEAPLATLPLMPRDEYARVVQEWNATRTEYPAALDVVQRFESHADRTPDAPAVAFEGRRYTYRELDERTSRLAHHLRSLGAGPEVRVGLYLERSLDTVVGVLGILKSGAAYVPIDPSYPADRVRFMLEDAGAFLVVTEAHLADPLQGSPSLRPVCLDRDAEALARHPATRPERIHGLEHLMYVLFTSGSTGKPKGVAVEHRTYGNYLEGILRRLDAPPASHFAIVSTFAADLGTTMVYGALTTGGCLHVLSHDRAADPAAFADYLRKNPIDVLKLVPSHFETLRSLSALPDLLPRARLVFAGEACPWDTVAAIRAAAPDLVIQNHYGPTETSVATLTYVPPRALPQHRGPSLPLGRPLGNTRVYVLDARGQPVPVGVPGELHVGGAGVTRGYLGRPALTAERFIPDPFSDTPGGRLYRTGDLARLAADSTVTFLGRIDHQVKIRGYRIETGEIEALIQAHAGVRDAVVLLREDTPGDKRLVAYLVLAEGEATTPDTVIAGVRGGLRAALPDYMVPGAFVVIPALPLNPNGKLDRFALPAPSAERATSSEPRVAPRNDLEASIAAVWASVLGVTEVGIDENFFELGGESFKAVRAVRGIGRDVSVMDLFRFPTVRKLAEHLSRGSTEKQGLLHRLTRADAKADGVTWVCVPFGGGSAISYLNLAEQMPAGDALFAVELPGHDYARRDDALQKFDVVARLVAEEALQRVKGPILLYGHCLGAAMAVAVARHLEDKGAPLLGIMVGGSFPMPRLPGALFDIISKMLPTDGLVSTRSIVDGLLVTGGASGNEDPVELEFLARNMRHDGREAEDFYTRAYRGETGPPLRTPLVCVVGERDRATEFYREEFLEWGRFSRSISLEVIPHAGHFFQKHQAKELSALGHRQALRWRQGASGEAPPVPEPAVAPSLGTFLTVTVGQLVSMIGTGLSTFALGVWAYQQTGAVSGFALMSTLGLLPGILVLPIAGALADRWDRRKIMIACDALTMGVAAIAAMLSWSGSLQMGHLYVLSVVSAMTGAFRQPAYTAAVAQLAPKRYIGHANGLAQLGGATGVMLSQMLGGALMLALGLHRILLLDVVTFGIALATLLAVRFPSALFRKQEEPFLQEVTQGWRYLQKRKGLLALAVFFALGNCLASVANVLVTPLVLSFSSAAELGSVMAMNGVGMLLGSLAMSLWGGTQRRMDGMIGFIALFGLSAVGMGLRPALGFPMAGMLGIGVCTAFINAHWLSLVQVKVGLELQGRVLAANQMLARSLMPLGALLAGRLVDRVFTPLLADVDVATRLAPVLGEGPGRGIALLVVLTGVLSLVLTVLGFLYAPLRRVEDALPDAIPDPVILDKDALQQQADLQLSKAA
ncbi:non-ribosomal peptide synthetase/MFS transporter [Corallococcus sicarius]|uniref:Amino acid adenylation domain-containing protein n=1 Tax=Corallococcus sicarius TaxID=2316726 RepID=A0A3A8NP57_9BACT|nr:non-ribosomal peptide synthetase/MFS transporter [Corallococcus sicarius]RKH45833.1 amino acid adenylation domain-containing protein [Corallococcus sicarius]